MSAYSEYATSGQSLGKILFTLERIGIPLRIVESVIHDGNLGLLYCGERFAHYKWEGEVPVFQFADEHYNKLPQPKHYHVEFVESASGLPSETHEFNTKEELKIILEQRSPFFMGRSIRDCLDNLFDDDLNLVCKYSTTLVEKANRLKMKFGK